MRIKNGKGPFYRARTPATAASRATARELWVRPSAAPPVDGTVEGCVCTGGLTGGVAGGFVGPVTEGPVGGAGGDEAGGLGVPV